MSRDNQSTSDMEFWIIPLTNGEDEPYAKGLEFDEAGEKLIEATLKEDGVDYVLKPVKK